MCGESIHKRLEYTFRASLNDESFLSEWKEANVVPINNKEILKNYMPVSLFPICAKIFERIICNRIFEYLFKNNITERQTGFKPGDYCINQLLSITHDMYKSLDDGFEGKGVFLGISKVFDKVWLEGLIHKVKQNGISGKLLNILKDTRKQRPVLYGQFSSWASITVGVPHGSILGLLFFLIYINDLSKNPSQTLDYLLMIRLIFQLFII